MSQRVEEQPERNDEEAGGGPLQRLLEASSGAISLLRGKRSGSTLSAGSGDRGGNMSRNCLAKAKSCFVGNALTFCTILGVCAGIVLGFSLRFSKSEPWSERDKMYVEFVGTMFLRMLKALILPLIVSSLISAIGSLDMSLSGRIGARAMIYYMSTTLFAVVLGIILVVTIHPGRSDVTKATEKDTNRNVTTADTLMDLARNMLPPNLVQAAIYQYRTVLVPPKNKQAEENNETEYETTSIFPMAVSTGATNESAKQAAADKQQALKDELYTWKIDSEYHEGMNILGLVVFSTVLGITLGKMQARGQPLLKFFTCMSEAMMIITNWVVWLSPIGVLFLIAGKLLEKEDFGQIIGQLGLYFVTVLGGLFIHGLVVLPIMYSIITKKLPFRFIANMGQTLVTAFGTASSSATLPITISCLEEKNGVDPRVARFVLPIGATINMDGTALYEAVAAIFIAQVREIPLSLGSIIAISITATAASIGAAGIPQAGLVTMVMVLDTVGLPSEDVSLILAVDWLLDRFRTTINVLGDSLGAGIVDHLSKKELENLPMNPDIHLSSSDHLNGKVLANNPSGSVPEVDPSYAKGPDDMGAEWQTTTM